ncbi:MAG: PfkB family carbohydrate kinase [Candidatus Peribacteraceae bacterium]|jgi:adenosine kinase|nr:PfkB family carbohydrate kinase [Candidatus Peribacteraceae bacterium]MDP7454249.1 PfkB family carbohydrate kinase [Candidatus Peribacteraceae bacterium]MDP7645841.1 PfkB family carbohydrate kinase [Candidatus Peribacteraceae bacterium]|tara:strand:- start:1190 stop:2125 length:936 start_codon:yes stop_codon:yes gene_type:complete
MNKILVTGSVAYDVLLGYDGEFADTIDPQALEALSVSYFSPHYARHFGGTGANIAWGLKLLGQEPILVSSVGHDGDDYLEKLGSKNISTDHIKKVSDHVTATAIINTDSSEHQIAFFHPGADSHGQWPNDLSPSEISYAIIGARDTTAMVQGMEWCSENNVKTFFDPGQQTIAFGDDAFERMVHMSAGIIVNEYEWEVTQKKLGCDANGVLKILSQVGQVGGFIIVTLGDKGCLLITHDGSELVPAVKSKKVINPTGAGDGFRAGFLAGLNEGQDLISACKKGCEMGKRAVEQEGTLLEDIDRPHKIDNEQ